LDPPTVLSPVVLEDAVELVEENRGPAKAKLSSLRRFVPRGMGRFSLHRAPSAF
jgi:hypothetical protein